MLSNTVDYHLENELKSELIFAHKLPSLGKYPAHCVHSGLGIFCLRGVSIMAFWTKTEKEKYQLRGSGNLFDDFLLY